MDYVRFGRFGGDLYSALQYGVRGSDVLLVQISSTTPQTPAHALVREALPLVGHIVREMLGRVPAHVSRDDLMSAGMLALVQAANAFDPERGVTFSGYAATRIRGAIVDELRGLDWASRSVRRRARQVDETRNKLAVTLGRVPTDAEVAQVMGIGVTELQSHRDDVARASVASLDGFEEGTADELLPASNLSPVDVLEQREKVSYLHDAVAQLPERLRVVIEKYFFQGLPMADIAAELGVTESRVSQLRAEAVGLMRGALTAALEPERKEVHARPNGCVAKRKEAYYASVAAHRGFAARVSTPSPDTHPA